MRSRRNYTGEFKSSFLSCEKDAEAILKKLFIDSQPYSDELKRLLMINTKDCLTDRSNPEYLKKIKNVTLKQLWKEEYVRIAPKLKLGENNEVQSYIILSFDNFTPTENDHYRDCVVSIDIICNTDFWNLDSFQARPIKIAGYIDGLLDEEKFSGIGTLNFIGMNQVVLSENLAGYTLMYRAVHGKTEDMNPNTFGLLPDE